MRWWWTCAAMSTLRVVGQNSFFTHVACGLDTGVSVGGGPADRAGPIGSGAGARVGHLPAFARAPAPGAPQKFRRTEAGCAPRAQTAAEEYVRKALREPGGAVVVGEGGATGKDRGPDACLCTKADAPPLLSAFSAQALVMSHGCAAAGRNRASPGQFLGGGGRWERRIGVLGLQATQGASPKAPRPPPVAPVCRPASRVAHRRGGALQKGWGDGVAEHDTEVLLDPLGRAYPPRSNNTTNKAQTDGHGCLGAVAFGAAAAKGRPPIGPIGGVQGGSDPVEPPPRRDDHGQLGADYCVASQATGVSFGGGRLGFTDAGWGTPGPILPWSSLPDSPCSRRLRRAAIQPWSGFTARAFTRCGHGSRPGRSRSGELRRAM